MLALGGLAMFACMFSKSNLPTDLKFVSKYRISIFI